jgi:hypothetical protein
MPGGGGHRASWLGEEGWAPGGAYRASWRDGEGRVPGAGGYRASCMPYDSKERPDGGPFQEPLVLGEAPGSDCCSLAVL